MEPTQGACALPRRCCDASIFEVFRIYKARMLHAGTTTLLSPNPNGSLTNPVFQGRSLPYTEFKCLKTAQDQDSTPLALSKENEALKRKIEYLEKELEKKGALIANSKRS